MHTYLRFRQDCLRKLPKTSQEPWPTMPYENSRVKPPIQRGPRTPCSSTPSTWAPLIAILRYSNQRGAHLSTYDQGEPTASSLSADGFPFMAGPNFQPSVGTPTVISILRQLADGPENVLEM